MKNFKNLWAVALVLIASLFMVSCKDEEPTIIIEEGLNVADGYYFVVEGEDPVADKALLPEKVEGAGFAATDRDGFFGNYVFLNAGSYSIQNVVAKEVVSTISGALGDPIEEGETGYKITKPTEGGSAIVIANDGYYKVSYDETLNELIMMEVTSVSIIGNATPNGWGGDTNIAADGSASDAGFNFSASDLEMVSGEFKIRINDRWTIDRRIDKTAQEFDPTNGFVAYTNYGGAPTDLVPGGGNMAWSADDRGVYTFNITLSNAVGAELTYEKTGDIVVNALVPEENKWAVVGAATELGWPAGACGVADEDVDLVYQGKTGDTYTWTVELPLKVDQFKFRKNDCWDDGELNFNNTTVTGSAAANISNPDNGNMSCDVAGTYAITLTTSDEGVSYTADFTLL